MRGRGLFDQLEELAGVCDPDTKVVIIGATNDIGLYRELMKRGVSEYIVPPMTPIGGGRGVSTRWNLRSPRAQFLRKRAVRGGRAGGAPGGG